jgi:hypothetical protein
VAIAASLRARRAVYERRARGLAVAVAGLAVAACGSTGASPTPGDMTAVLEQLALHGASVIRTVSGDAGCADSALHSNAVRIDLTVDDMPSEQRVYLFRWRRPADFDAAADSFAGCVSGYSAPAEGAVETVEVPPWRAFGPNWSDELRQALEAGLSAAAGG